MTADRPVIAETAQTYENVVPLVDLLVERGHQPLDPALDRGFRPSPSGWVAALRGPITPEDWAELNRRFELPASFKYAPGGGVLAGWVEIWGYSDSEI